MSHNAAGTWSKPDVNGKREFTYGQTPLALGNVVRVMGYGYGARLTDCGHEGVVVGLRTKRVTVEFTGGTVRHIDPVVLSRVVQVYE